MQLSKLRRTLKSLSCRLISSTSAVMLALALLLSSVANSQTFQVLHAFTFGLDGAYPTSGLVMDQRGNLYGTATAAGTDNRGTIFELARDGSGWILRPLYSFSGNNDGYAPQSPLTIGPDGTLFGTTSGGGTARVGTVFNLRPPSNPCHGVICLWRETVIHNFTGSPDGANPGYGAAVFDAAGNLYNTTTHGGVNDHGVAYQLTRSGGGWTENIIFDFQPGTSGFQPYGGLIFDSSGVLYGSASMAGGGNGTVYAIFRTSSGWGLNILYTFPQGQQTSKGANPGSTLAFDSAGNLYGTTMYGGTNGAGAVYQLTQSGGVWTEPFAYGLTGSAGSGPVAGVAIDSTGNLYGTTQRGGAFGLGNVFKLTPVVDGWVYTDLHDFTGGSDGWLPVAGVLLDANGKIYGTATYGGSLQGNCFNAGCGVVWEITP
jgi:uncharacterized repeat protein (TIGR03803 family)